MLYRREQPVVDFINDFRQDQGKYLRVYRATLGLTQEEAAKKFGVAKLTWVRWESGRAEMKVISFAKFAKMWDDLWPVAA